MQHDEKSVIQKLLRMIAICGEVPRSETSWLGKYDAVIAALQMNKGVVQVSGTKIRTIRGSVIRKTKNRPDILTRMDSIGEGCGEYWKNNYRKRTMPGNEERIYRSHKIARTVIFMDECKIQIEPWNRQLFSETIAPQDNTFYTTREIRAAIPEGQRGEISGAQATGLLIHGEQPIMLYYMLGIPTRDDRSMESRFRFAIEEILSATRKDRVRCTTVYLLTPFPQTAIKYACKVKDSVPFFSTAIRDVRYLPADESGKLCMALWQIPNVIEKMADQFWPWPYERVRNERLEHARKIYEDGKKEHILLWLDANLTILRLVVEEANQNPDDLYTMIASESQASFLYMFFEAYNTGKEEMGSVHNVSIKAIPNASIEHWINEQGKEERENESNAG